jgi:hypothetical protein
MRLIPVSFDGHTLDTANYNPHFEPDALLQGPANASLTSLGLAYPEYGSKTLKEKIIVLNIEIVGVDPAVSVDTLKKWFDIETEALKILVAKDPDDGDRLWFVYATPINEPDDAGDNLYSVSLLVPDPVWETVNDLTETWSLVASGVSHVFTTQNVGNKPAFPKIKLDPTADSVAGFTYKKHIIVYNTHPYALPYSIGAVDITDGGLNTATLIGAGKMQADGDDWRVHVDGIDWPRWITGINTASSKMWAVLSHAAGIPLTLSGSISNVGVPATIPFKYTTTNLANVKKLPAKGAIVVVSGGVPELFLYNGVSVSGTLNVTVTARAAWDTAAASHADGDAIYWVEHEVVMCYGNSSLTAPDQDESRKPVFDLVNSTNAAWVYTEFFDAAGTRSGSWLLSLFTTTGDESRAYSGSHVVDPTDPAEVMGISVRNWVKNGLPQADTVDAMYLFWHPATITSLTSITMDTYRSLADWPTIVQIQKSKDGKTWTLQKTVTKPASAATWTAFSSATETLGAGYPYVNIRVKGSVTAKLANEADVEAQGLTVNLPAGAGITIKPMSEVTSYQFATKITNTINSRWLEFDRVTAPGITVTIDTDERDVSINTGENAFSALVFDDMTQLNWLPLEVGGNTVKIDDAGLAGMDITFTWKARSS